MTAIKQISITTAAHAANLAKYLNDNRAIARASQNIVNEENWEAEMARTRAAYGHDVSCRAGAKNTIMYQHVLGFNPDECAPMGGVVTPDLAMRYARDWVQMRYPNQEAVWVLHLETCDADGSSRYAVHMAIGRTDLETGKRLHEGMGQKAKIARASAIRSLDARYGLRQMEKGKRNSRVHARQPTRAERAMSSRGVRTDKQYIREAVRTSIAEARLSGGGDPYSRFVALLEAKGVRVSSSKTGQGHVFERMRTGLRVSGYKLGRGFSAAGIAKGLGVAAAKSVARSADEEMCR